MELKRIIANDAAAATEEILSSYGTETLIISNRRMNDKTEIIVAIDLMNDPTLSDDPELGDDLYIPTQGTDANAQAAAKAINPTAGPAVSRFVEAMSESRRTLSRGPSENCRDNQEAGLRVDELEDAHVAYLHVRTLVNEVSQKLVALHEDVSELKARTQPLSGINDALSSLNPMRMELTQLRAEVAMLRKQLQLPDQALRSVAPPHGTSTEEPGSDQAVEKKPPNALDAILEHHQVPSRLCAMMRKQIAFASDTRSALASIRTFVSMSVTRHRLLANPVGIHLIAGPGGAGKTSMAVRLAKAGALSHGHEQVAIIAFEDARIGAWPELQSLCAKDGIESYRAADRIELKALIDDLLLRKLLIVDISNATEGNPVARVQSVLREIGLEKRARTHLALAADSNSATLESYLQRTPGQWNDAVISRIDCSSTLWPTLDILIGQALPYHLCSDTPGTTDPAAGDALLDGVMTILCDEGV